MGAVVGSIIGVKTAINIPEVILKIIFVVVLLGVGLKEVYSAVKVQEQN
jgi:uncharacterized membrane protein YfcA